MSGRVLTLGLVFFALVFGAALWWFQTRAYYAPIEGVEEIVVAGVPIPVEDWEGIDADTSPLKLRACFRLALDPPPATRFFPSSTRRFRQRWTPSRKATPGSWAASRSSKLKGTETPGSTS